MKAAASAAVRTAFLSSPASSTRFLPLLHPNALLLLPLTLRRVSSSSSSSPPPPSAAANSEDLPLLSPLMEEQFEGFRHQLDESGGLRDRIRTVVTEVEAASRLATAGLLLVHQSLPLPDVLGKVKAQIDVVKGLFAQLADILKECPGQYYRYHGDWRSETQSVVSILAFMHWLETGRLLMHAEAAEKLGLDSPEFGLDVEDYLIVCKMHHLKYSHGLFTCLDCRTVFHVE